MQNCSVSCQKRGSLSSKNENMHNCRNNRQTYQNIKKTTDITHSRSSCLPYCSTMISRYSSWDPSAKLTMIPAPEPPHNNHSEDVDWYYGAIKSYTVILRVNQVYRHKRTLFLCLQQMLNKMKSKKISALYDHHCTCNQKKYLLL